MTRKMILSALASVALVTAGTAMAKPGSIAGQGPKAAAKAKGKPAAKARGNARLGAAGSMKAKGRSNSQGRAHASPRALERASERSVLAGDSVVSGPLAGLAVGTPIHVNGEVAGTVERIVPSDSRVSNVLVRLNSGRIVPLAPGSLVDNGGVWSATGLTPSANRH